MKALKLFSFLLLTSLIFAACNRNNDDVIDTNVDPIIGSVNDLVVPAAFDWKTQPTIDVIVKLPQ